MTRGSCLCGETRFQITGKTTKIGMCHVRQTNDDRTHDVLVGLCDPAPETREQKDGTSWSR